MDDIMKFMSDYWLIIFIVLSFFGWGGYSSATAPGRALRKKFAALGELKGKTKQEIVAVAGNPAAIAGTSDGKTCCQWMKSGFHIVLIFNGEICEGIASVTDVSDVSSL